MPRNPKAVALDRARRAQANYERGEGALATLGVKRRKAMYDCVRAGCSLTETGKVFGITRSGVAKAIEALGKEAA